MAFGHEVGRALSDGQIIGRSEPFAKVFPSSRVVKRAVGLVAWGVLEDIALDAYLDANGRLVAETSVRRIARNLGLNKDTVTRHLAKLREYGFVMHEENRDDGSGRYAICRYILDPSACIERFTTTPSTPSAGSSTAARKGDGREKPRRHTPRPSPQPGCPPLHRGDPHSDLDLRLRTELEQLGVAVNTAAQLVQQFPPERIRAALAAARAARPRSPAGWVIAALREGWTVPQVGLSPSAPPPAAEPPIDPSISPEKSTQWDQWDLAVSSVLDDQELRALAIALCSPVPGVGWLIPAVRAEVIRWASWHCASTPGALDPTLKVALMRTLEPAPPQWQGPEGAPPGSPAAGAAPLAARLRSTLTR